MFGRVIDGMETVRALEETEREARPPAPGTTLVKLVCLRYPACAAEYVLVVQIVRETDNAVIHPVNQVEIVDCGELAMVIAQLQIPAQMLDEIQVDRCTTDDLTSAVYSMAVGWHLAECAYADK